MNTKLLTMILNFYAFITQINIHQSKKNYNKLNIFITLNKKLNLQMKKTKLIIGFLMLTICFNVYGQEKSTEFGLKTGINFAKYNGDLIGAEYKGKVGFYVGGFANFKISDKFKIQPELLYALQGSNYVSTIEVREDPSEPTVVGEFKVKSNESTISIPIVAQYFVVEKFYFEAGPQIGIIISHKDEVIESPTDDPSFYDTSGIDYDTFDFGFAVGAGYKLSEKFNVNFRYFFGLIERDFSKVKSSVLNLGVEYKL